MRNMNAEDFTNDDRCLLDPEYYAKNGYPFERWNVLRKEDPVHLVEDWDGPPFWALTRQAEIIEVSKTPAVFSNVPRGNMEPGGKDPTESTRNLLKMDPPEHQAYRSIVSRKFTPAAMSRIYENVDEFTRQVFKRVATHGEVRDIEFVENVSARIPIWVIAEMLGISRDDWEQLYIWTNQVVGASDAEYQEGRTEEETRNDGLAKMFEYFSKLSEERLHNRQDDLISDLVHAEIDGKRLETLELMSYYVTLLTAGNETTRNAITGGILALIEYPDQFAKLKENPNLIDQFVEEVLRYVSPVIHMCRTPTQDVELAGKKIKAGEPLVLFFPSANRDESVFENPDQFNLERNPNPHLAFGIGEHFCLGTHVARLELRAVFRQLIKGLKSIELIDRPSRLQHVIVGGIKRLNVRYEFDMGDAV